MKFVKTHTSMDDVIETTGLIAVTKLGLKKKKKRGILTYEHNIEFLHPFFSMSSTLKHEHV